MSTSEGDFFKLDQNELDKEWVRQPELYYRYATELSETRHELEKLKAEKELTIAELDRDVRRNPQQFGLEKTTETTVQNTIVVQRRYQEVNDAFLKALHAVDVCKVAVDTLDHRKKALENSVSLWLANYFSKPSSKDHKERMDKVETAAAFGSGKKRKA